MLERRDTLDVVKRCVEVIQIPFQICQFSSFKFVIAGFVESQTFTGNPVLL